MIKARPFKGRFMTRRKANRINHALLTSERPDRTVIEKEAKEFIEFIKNTREMA